jgi:hypothetical protein
VCKCMGQWWYVVDGRRLTGEEQRVSLEEKRCCGICHFLDSLCLFRLLSGIRLRVGLDGWMDGVWVREPLFLEF